MKDRNITASPQRAQESDAAKKQEYTSVNIIFETTPTGRAKFQPGAESKTNDQIAAWEQIQRPKNTPPWQRIKSAVQATSIQTTAMKKDHAIKVRPNHDANGKPWIMKHPNRQTQNIKRQRNQKPMTKSQPEKLIKPNEEKSGQSWQRTNAKNSWSHPMR
jgi:hypothetical protein